jgi:hypothetical protein
LKFGEVSFLLFLGERHFVLTAGGKGERGEGGVRSRICQWENGRGERERGGGGGGGA